MTFNIKNRGRKKENLKLRGFKGITPKGFEFVRVSRKDKALVYKRIDHEK